MKVKFGWADMLSIGVFLLFTVLLLAFSIIIMPASAAKQVGADRGLGGGPPFFAPDHGCPRYGGC